MAKSSTIPAWRSQFLTAKDALAPRPPRQYICQPFFVLPSLNVLYGISGSHKTNLAIDLAICVTLGRKWLQGKAGTKLAGYSTCQSPVIWIDQDSGSDALHERFGAALRVYGGDDKTPIYYLSFPNPPFVADKAEAIALILEAANDYKSRLLVFDNLGTISGGRDENSYEMIGVMNSLRRISQLTRAAVIAIHHDPKYETGQRKTPRGHSSIEAAIDLALWVQRDGDCVTLTATKTRGALFDPFSAQYAWEHRKGTLELETARFFGIDVPLDAASQMIETAICDYLMLNTTANQTQLVIECQRLSFGNKPVGRHKVLGQLKQMVKSGTIKEKRGTQNTVVYSL